MAKPNAFDIPRIYYFQSKNTFTGSRGNFNFKIVPDEELKVVTWHGFINSELAEIEHQASFPISTDGHEEMISWLEQMYKTGKNES